MLDIDLYLKKLKSVRANVRDEAAQTLRMKIGLEECSKVELDRIRSEIESNFLKLGVRARPGVLDILIQGKSQDEYREIIWRELGYAYRQFRAGHDYMVDVLHMICMEEFGDADKVGDYFDIEKQFKLAFELLKSVDSDVLK